MRITPRHRTPDKTGERHEAESSQITALFAVLAGGRIVFLVQRFLRPGAVGKVRRRRLVAGRRLGQRFPRRLALERRGLGLVAAEQAAEAAVIAELRRAQDRVGVGCAGLDRVVAGAGGTGGLAGGEFGSASAMRAASLADPCCLLAGRGRSLAALLVGVLRPVRRRGFGRADAGGGRSSLGGTTSGDRSRYSMPRFSMLVPPMPAMMPVDDLLLEGLVVVVVVVGARRRLRPSRGRCPAATTASRSARVSGRQWVLHNPNRWLRSRASRCSCSNFPQGRRSQAHSAAPARRARISRDQGAFAAGTPRKESYSRAATPATMATSARLNTYQLKVFPPICDVEQGEIDHRAIGEAVDGVADGAADDQAERDRRPAGFATAPSRSPARPPPRP